MITLEKEDIFDLYLAEEDESKELGYMAFNLEYGTALELNLLILKKLLEEWGYSIVSKYDIEIDPESTYHSWDTVMRIQTDFPYDRYIKEKDAVSEPEKSL